MKTILIILSIMPAYELAVIYPLLYAMLGLISLKIFFNRKEMK
jgi:hypothetical protein